jgi:hypothetical protein
MKNVLIQSFIAALSISTSLVSCSKVQHYELSRFVSPETCGGCHEEIYKQWKGSMHSLSHVDTLYREVALHDLKGLSDSDEIKEAEHCVSCHTPVGFFSGMPAKTSDHLKKIPDMAQKGVQCDFCHSATGAGKIYNADIKLDPGHGEEDPGIKRGPLGDSKPDFHKAAYSKFHTQAEICGVCHDVRHVVFGTKLETPYEEWKKGPYAEQGIPCQDCHMRQRPGVPATGSTKRPDNPGFAASGGPKRKHVYTHYFTGSNTLIPGQFGFKEQITMAEERLKNAATVSIGDALKGGKLQVTVTNSGAGHSLPTGLSHVRQMWLEVTVSDRNGSVLYHSGGLDVKGRLESGALLYNTVFGDGKGKPVMNVARAREILKDKRIEPLKSSRELFQLPLIKDQQVTVDVKLWYRLVSQELADAVLGSGKIKIPVVLMAEAKKVVKNE